MLQWSPFWRWLATGVLAAMTIAWLAQGHTGHRDARFATGHEGWRMHMMPGMVSTAGACAAGASTTIVMPGRAGNPAQAVCVTSDGKVTVNGSPVAGGATPALSPALQRQRTQLQRQESELQQQRAQLGAHVAAIQARLNSLGQ